ncbi:MAG: hypothetical protein AAF610_06185 [Pseudomonadota bacterium]
MFRNEKSHAVITAVLPDASARRVLGEIEQHDTATALTWNARGTLLREHWLSRFMPMIEPGKTILQMIVPDDAADDVMDITIRTARLHQQANGAVFSLPSVHSHVGSEFHAWPVKANDDARAPRSVHLRDSLDLICAIVGSDYSERVARAAVDAGAHGPVVYFSDGRGLRDRIGWLRITKDHQQEVQMVLVDRAESDNVFDAMARAGKFHLPGRGLMYAMPVGHGMVNLPSRVSRSAATADMQQIVRAIDHLAGHAQWRDRSHVNPGAAPTSVEPSVAHRATSDRVALTAVVKDEHLPRMTDLILDGGAGGLNQVNARFVGADDLSPESAARIHHEYVVLRSIVARDVAEYICQVVHDTAEDLGVRDMCLLAHPVGRLAKYVPGAVDYRAAAERKSA